MENLTITDLDSNILWDTLFAYPNFDTSCPIAYGFDTATYPGYLSNWLNTNCFEGGVVRWFTRGLGQTSGQVGNFDGNNWITWDTGLVYYSNGINHYGTPYYILNGSNLVAKYVPLPEQCAVWTSKAYGPPQAGDPPQGHLEIVEQVRTGIPVPKNGIRYVQLIYRGVDYETGVFIPDTTVGYFYNDSVNRVAWIVPDTNSNSSNVLCPFNQLNGQECSGTREIYIDSTLIGSRYSVTWNCIPGGGPGDTVATNIAGIGPTNSLVHLLYYYLGPYDVVPGLTSLCVCGEIIYPKDSVANCTLISGINEVILAGDFRIYPTVTSNSITIETAAAENSGYEIYDMDGRILMQGVIATGKSELNIGKLADGMYLFRLTNHESAVRRFIVQH